MTGKSIRFGAFLLVAAGFALLAPSLVFAQVDVPWLSSLDDAKSSAAQKGLSVAALITAPSWCEPCRTYEEGTLQDPLVVGLLSTQFVPLYLVDTNPDHLLFDFPSYPSLVILSADGRQLETISGRPAAEALIEKLRPYVAGNIPEGVKAKESSLLSFQSSDGKVSYVQTGESSYERRDEGETTTLVQYDQDDEYLYLKDDTSGLYLALPRSGGTLWKWDARGQNWTESGEVNPVSPAQ